MKKFFELEKIKLVPKSHVQKLSPPTSRKETIIYLLEKSEWRFLQQLAVHAVQSTNRITRPQCDTICRDTLFRFIKISFQKVPFNFRSMHRFDASLDHTEKHEIKNKVRLQWSRELERFIKIKKHHPLLLQFNLVVSSDTVSTRRPYNRLKTLNSVEFHFIYSFGHLSGHLCDCVVERGRSKSDTWLILHALTPTTRYLKSSLFKIEEHRALGLSSQQNEQPDPTRQSVPLNWFISTFYDISLSDSQKDSVMFFGHCLRWQGSGHPLGFDLWRLRCSRSSWDLN